MPAFMLAEPIAAYLKATMQGPDEVARCFTPHGVVYDKGRIHAGREAIKAWKAGSSSLSAYAIVPFSAALVDGVHVIGCHVAGNFPGCHVDLSLRFRLERGLVASLEIGGQGR